MKCPVHGLQSRCVFRFLPQSEVVAHERLPRDVEELVLVLRLMQLAVECRTMLRDRSYRWAGAEGKESYCMQREKQLRSILAVPSNRTARVSAHHSGEHALETCKGVEEPVVRVKAQESKPFQKVRCHALSSMPGTPSPTRPSCTT